jgi:pyrimidine-nucleoside phosphorylase
MRMVDLILKKRAGGAHDAPELAFIADGAAAGSLPDYQLAAWLMAVCFQGMTADETAAFARAIAASGTTLDLHAAVRGVVVDKHSTGGVGDKATLVVAPIVAACGVPVAKLSGRGLGHTGGTIDKLESIAGFNAALSSEQFLATLANQGLAIAGQSAELAPADGRLYALRDVTGTVDSLPLIATSIMGKKLAGGADAILLDVKCGTGALMQTRAQAQALAQTMVEIGRAAGRRMHAVITAMDQPLGNAAGNALEIAEAVATLRGEGPADLRLLCRHEAAALLLLAGRAANQGEADMMVDEAIRSGAALQKFIEVVAAQGGAAELLQDPTRLPRAAVIAPLPAPRAGWVSRLDARTVGEAVLQLGAGRASKDDTVRPEVGVVLHHKIGDHAAAAEPLLAVHAASAPAAEAALSALLTAYSFSDAPVPPPPVLLGDL